MTEEENREDDSSTSYHKAQIQHSLLFTGKHSDPLIEKLSTPVSIFHHRFGVGTRLHLRGDHSVPHRGYRCNKLDSEVSLRLIQDSRCCPWSYLVYRWTLHRSCHQVQGQIQTMISKIVTAAIYLNKRCSPPAVLFIPKGYKQN